MEGHLPGGCLSLASCETADALATMFDYTPEIRRLIYTTNVLEGYNRQLRKVTKNRGALPSSEAIRKLLWLAHQDIAKK